MPRAARLRSFSVIALVVTLGAIFGACAGGDPVDAGQAGDEQDEKDPASTGGSDEEAICLLHNCNSDAECGACSGGRTKCLLAEHRCVACDAATGTGCLPGEYCSSWGKCVPDGLTCETDPHGTPLITCAQDADCAACDPMHQICNAEGQCVACTPENTSECMSTDQCVDFECTSKCPKTCDVDADCSACGAPGHEAHACNAHKCAECSPTMPCPNGETCTPQGTCVKVCGSDGDGKCQSDADCASCGGGNTACHKPINSSTGTCGVEASGCSDLGEGTVVLPEPWSEVTNLCSNDADCAGVGVQINVGEMLRDLTGIDSIGDANVEYGMNTCAAITVGSGSSSVSCGVCVPCQVDSDCQPIDIDQVALEAFGPLGSLAAAFLLDQVFGPNDHVIHMYCEQVGAGYGVCSPCPGFIYECGIGSGGGGGGGGGESCGHDVCSFGSPLGYGCSACTQNVCDVDPYCCDTAWDSQCIAEVDLYCAESCEGGSSSSSGGGGGSCAHDECDTGGPLSAGCSACAADVCSADPYCCSTAWDEQCVSEVDQFCSSSCGGGSSSSGGGGSSCGHDECSTGNALDPFCSSCAFYVCDYDPYCCDVEWDGQCVDEASEICGCF